MERRQQAKRQWQFSDKVKSFNWKALLLISIVMTLFGLLLFNILVWSSDVSKLSTPEPRPTFIYDQKGEIASKISQSKIEGVSIEEIPPNMINAVISTEDQRFYKHGGINYFGIAKALIKNLFSGEIVAGGSTITQQLAKNAFLTQERTYTRKFKEVILTTKIERKYSKDEIIERYLNQIYFGEGTWGIQRAAIVYFGKDVSQLSLSESATIAGLIKAPSILSPYKNMEKSLERRNLVLSLMKNEGYISEEELEKAKNQPIVLAGETKTDYNGKYPYYVDLIIDEAVKKYHLTEKEVLSGGLHIYTELNPTVQDAVEEVYQEENNFPASKPDQLIQSGSVFLNPHTGGISALVGGRGEYAYGHFNHATELIRQPGSSMKPLAVYTPALERGYEMFDMLSDNPININGYQPLNYDKQYRGQVTMYDALVQSYNVPPVWLLQKVGIENGVKSVEQFGIPLEKEDHIPGLALGGLTKGTSPLQMAQAFSSFPNNGNMVDAHAILKIEDGEGKSLGKWEKREKQVTEPIVAQKITYMLKGAVEQGTGKKAAISGLEVAGKTGTTEVPFSGAEGAKDHWFVGYTPDIVGAVWLGYDKTDLEHHLTSSGGATATTIFQQIVSKSMAEFPSKEFELPLIEKVLKEQEQKKREQEKERKEEDEDKKEKKKNDKEEKKGKRNKEDRKDEDEDDDDD